LLSTCRMPMLALTGKARLWEPGRLLRRAAHWPWTAAITTALDRFALLPNPC
jgi:hypothetical protein